MGQRPISSSAENPYLLLGIIVSQSPEGATTDFRSGDIKGAQPLEGSTTDLRGGIGIAPGANISVAIPRWFDDQFLAGQEQVQGRHLTVSQSPEGSMTDFRPSARTASSTSTAWCRNPPKGRRPISGQSIASSTPRFKNDWCRNPPKGRRPISWLSTASSTSTVSVRCRNPPKGRRTILGPRHA